MRKVILIVGIFIMMALISLPLQAREVTSNQIQPLVKNYILSHYKPMYKGEIGINIERISGIPIKVPDGKLEIKISGALKDNFVQRTIVRATVLVNGRFIRAIGIPVTLSLYDNVWVANQPIQRDGTLNGANVELARKDISKIANTAARSSNNLINKKVIKNFRTGEILDHHFIKDCPIVVRSSMVEVVFKSKTVAITIPCEAMEDGSLGDLVRVKSREFNKQYIGKVIDKNTVMVNI